MTEMNKKLKIHKMRDVAFTKTKVEKNKTKSILICEKIVQK